MIRCAICTGVVEPTAEHLSPGVALCAECVRHVLLPALAHGLVVDREESFRESVDTERFHVRVHVAKAIVRFQHRALRRLQGAK